MLTFSSSLTGPLRFCSRTCSKGSVMTANFEVPLIMEMLHGNVSLAQICGSSVQLCK